MPSRHPWAAPIAALLARNGIHVDRTRITAVEVKDHKDPVTGYHQGGAWIWANGADRTRVATILTAYGYTYTTWPVTDLRQGFYVNDRVDPTGIHPISNTEDEFRRAAGA